MKAALIFMVLYIVLGTAQIDTQAQQSTYLEERTPTSQQLDAYLNQYFETSEFSEYKFRTEGLSWLTRM